MCTPAPVMAIVLQVGSRGKTGFGTAQVFAAQIGTAPRTLERFIEQGLDLPSGVLLFTGPTGSRKTATVYSCINKINTPQISNITAEEPVETQLEDLPLC